MSEFIKSPFGKLFVSFFAVIIGLIAIAGAVQLVRRNQNNNGAVDNYEQFSSCADLENYVFKDRVDYGYPYYGGKSATDNFLIEAPIQVSESQAGGTSTGEVNVDFSETNIQVEGVDESDIIKTDGSYIYLVRGTSILVFDAKNPVESSKLAQFEVPGNPIEMFLHNNQLIVLAGTDNYYGGYYGSSFDKTAWPMESSQNGIFVYDVSNPAKPDLKREVKIEGNYKTARLTDDTVYLITHKNIAYIAEDQAIDSTIPRYSNSEVPGQIDYVQAADCEEISRFGDDVYNYVSVVALDTKTGNSDVSVLVGSAANVYVSRSNIYLATTRYEYPETPEPMPQPIMPFFDAQSDMMIAPPYQNPEIYTDIFKLGMSGTQIEFKAEGSVPGTILNQFSMDEFDGNFRIGTNTVSQGNWNEDMSNNIYVLDAQMKRIGSIEGVAPGEKIYSTRFLGDRLYMVTFKTVDPFFVIDLSKPTKPEILGELKIPGFSDYLHPYDENHVIGFGKNTVAAGSGAVRPTGLKIALFDVRDVKNPLLKSEISFGSSYSDSEILYNHKALLFDRERELLVIPASFDITSPETGVSESFNGFLSMKINLTEGLSERGRINDSSYDNYYYGYGSKRSLFIDSFIFATLGDGLGVFKIDTMELVKKISYE